MNPHERFTPSQARAARGLLNWTPVRLAEVAGVEVEAVELFEDHAAELGGADHARLGHASFRAGVSAKPSTLHAGEGVRFRTPEGARARPPPTAQTVIHDANAVRAARLTPSPYAVGAQGRWPLPAPAWGGGRGPLAHGGLRNPQRGPLQLSGEDLRTGPRDASRRGLFLLPIRSNRPRGGGYGRPGARPPASGRRAEPQSARRGRALEARLQGAGSGAGSTCSVGREWERAGDLDPGVAMGKQLRRQSSPALIFRRQVGSSPLPGAYLARSA